MLASLSTLRAYFIFHGDESYKCLNCSSLKAGNALDSHHTLISCWNIRGRCVLTISLSPHPANPPTDTCKGKIDASISFLYMKLIVPTGMAVYVSNGCQDQKSRTCCFCSSSSSQTGLVRQLGRVMTLLMAVSWKTQPTSAFGIPVGQQWAAVGSGNKHSETSFSSSLPLSFAPEHGQRLKA